ncbi:MAG: GNAT family N-acetyltransferase [Desulfobacterales bacterium]|nr:GNAT family N-acetyltransferase [Desulfobacterales bacterium]
MRYPKEVVLKDCSEANIRQLEAADEEKLIQFYKDLPESDRWWMRYDVTDPAVIRKWIKRIDLGMVYSTVAVTEKRIVAHASLHMREFGCTQHVGRLRIMVLPDCRQIRLGTWMLLDLIHLAMEKGLDELRSDFVVGVEDGAIEAAYKLDFFKKALLTGYVQDKKGNRFDLMIMMKRLHRDLGDF